MRTLRIFALATLALVLTGSVALAAPAPGESMFMASSSTQLQKLEECDTLHHEQTCDRYHVVGVGSQQASVNLEGQQFNVDWSGVGFRLDTGAVITRTDSGSWEQVYPSRSAVQVTDWNDVDGSDYLTVTDSLQVDGQPAKVTDQRLYLWVSPQK